ncbi:hypothetical protein Tel_12575 [Candidatus Tenderia electrophaga]|jgi:hypothetical protein|uniref:Uncharacterized protein n=1 Tax=Candidatus Tenderia electrophaga TaxID=1748243 RepID=A0A0S2TFQ4_9GAMM|nr:hypothetical protein Tel_12575 [Candidatus Tenderia electrophaga]
MFDYSTGMMIWIVVLIAVVPYVHRIRHPDQKFLAAYLIFLFSFIIASSALYALLAWLVEALNLTRLFGDVMTTLTFLILVFVPAFLVARWLTRKPPSQHNTVPP